MLVVDKIAMALSVVDYPSYLKWIDVHEYTQDPKSLNRWTECKAYKKALLACFTVDDLRQLFLLTHENDV